MRSAGWVDLYSPPVYNPLAEEFLVRAPILDGDYGHFRHILKVSVVELKYSSLIFKFRMYT